MSFDIDSGTSDEALLVLFANGDPDAARSLTLRLAPRILGLSARLLGDRAEAEDVTQEAMLRLWRIAPDWKQDDAMVQTWLYRVARNLCLDRLRKKRAMTLDDIDEAADDVAPIDARLIEKDRARALAQALARLPERQRDAVQLRLIDGLQNPEIAQVLGVSVEAVESLTARGKRALKALLLPQKDELGLKP